MKGKIIKGVGGQYLVSTENGVFTASARGKLKQFESGLLVGDIVEIELEKDNYAVEKIYERKNSLKRPKVANIDAVVILISAVPEPDFLLIDKMLIYAILKNIEAFIVVNKSDLSNVEALFHRAKFEYGKSVSEVFLTSTLNGHNIESLKIRLFGKMVCLVGQSAVGKSSLMNILCEKADFAIGELSKINRGRHTTRHSEILEGEKGTFYIDTPGFSFLEFDLDYRELKDYYPDFFELSKGCRYKNKCLHINEPDCKVKEALQSGEIAKERYERYIELYKEFETKWRRQYD